jgi:hypothetical protein
VKVRTDLRAGEDIVIGDCEPADRVMLSELVKKCGLPVGPLVSSLPQRNQVDEAMFRALAR